MGAYLTYTSLSLLAQAIVWEVPAQGLRSTVEISPLGCRLPLLTSAELSTQFKSLTSSESIWVMAGHGLSLLPAPGVTQLLNFSDTVLVGYCRPSRCACPSW